MSHHNAFEKLLDYISSFIAIGEDEIKILAELTQVKQFKKGAFLLKAGKVANAFFYNASGIIRLYYEVNNEERTGFFYNENVFINPYASFRKQEPSAYFLRAIKDTDVVIFKYDILESLLNKVPKLEKLARMIMEQELMVLQEVVESMVTLSPEERFVRLMEKNPEIFQQNSQAQIASFLGIKPESLSRIKRRNYQKGKSI